MFFSPDPEATPGSNLVLYNTLWRPGEAVVARGTIARIGHPQLGCLSAVEIGLDYTFVHSDGRSLTVNAEECPGEIGTTCGHWSPSELEISDWTLTVEFTELGALRPLDYSQGL